MLKKVALILSLLISFSTFAQKVGVVLSGGGAAGLAHIGFLKSLEENNIPIDYISGTSMGAIIGGLYASGYSVSEIEAIFKNKEFQDNLLGILEEDKHFFFNENEQSPTLINWEVNPGDEIETILPTSFINSFPLDYKLLRYLGPISSIYQGDFDQLMIPFRCTAADISKKQVVVFKDGSLTNAIRASSTYPFYVEPVDFDGTLYFDGGLYDNFPVEVMIEDFKPDIILGSNVSYNFDPPKKNDVLSHIKNMVVAQTEYSLKGNEGVIITPSVSEISTFDFKMAEAAIDSGYKATQGKIPSIYNLITNGQRNESIEQKRAAFRSKIEPVLFSNINIINTNVAGTNYLKKTLQQKDEFFTFETLGKRYFKLYEDPFFESLYPNATFDTATNKYTLSLIPQRTKAIQVSLGGNLSSKPINTGYVGIKHKKLWESFGTIIGGNVYFGKYYTAVEASTKIIKKGKIPFSTEAFFNINRWDYFESRATFFQEANPPFILIDNRFLGLEIAAPLKYHSVMKLDAKAIKLSHDYYQTSDFINTDTADATQFIGATFGLSINKNTLDHIQFPSQGKRISAQLRYNSGSEDYVPGNRIDELEQVKINRSWVRFNAQYDQYFFQRSQFKFGVHAQLEYNSRFDFSNFISTQIISPVFQPFPETKTLYSGVFRSGKFATLGITEILNLRKNIELRASAYVFQPFSQELKSINFKTKIGPGLGQAKYLGTAGLVWKLPLGPVSLHVNYIEGENQPWGIFFNVGYILSNRKAIY